MSPAIILVLVQLGLALAGVIEEAAARKAGHISSHRREARDMRRAKNKTIVEAIEQRFCPVYKPYKSNLGTR